MLLVCRMNILNYKGVFAMAKNKNCFKQSNSNAYASSFLSAAFLRGVAFGKNVSSFSCPHAIMSIADKADILFAVKKAYIDMSPRTFVKDKSWWKNSDNVKSNGNERTKGMETAWQQAKETVFQWLCDEFYTYFHCGCPDFDDWHKKVCGEFLKLFSPVLDTYGYDGAASLKYGKAQKIVNMTFKYLFCFDDACNYAGKFDECHMPIDSYILKWYNDWHPNSKVTTVWSELDDMEYHDIQINIKNTLGSYNPFLAEFYIWAEYNS